MTASRPGDFAVDLHPVGLKTAAPGGQLVSGDRKGHVAGSGGAVWRDIVGFGGAERLEEQEHRGAGAKEDVSTRRASDHRETEHFLVEPAGGLQLLGVQAGLQDPVEGAHRDALPFGRLDGPVHRIEGEHAHRIGVGVIVCVEEVDVLEHGGEEQRILDQSAEGGLRIAALAGQQDARQAVGEPVHLLLRSRAGVFDAARKLRYHRLHEGRGAVTRARIGIGRAGRVREIVRHRRRSRWSLIRGSVYAVRKGVRISYFSREVIIARTTRTNDQIRISPVRVIGAEGEQLGILPIEAARDSAREQGLDLVEVAPTARPPVCRIMDWGKHQYEQQKAAKEARKRQHTVDVKEVKLRPGTEIHDLQVKLRHARRFLQKGQKVKVTIRYRGREMRRPEQGYELLDRVTTELDDLAMVESRSREIMGRQLTMMLAPE